MISPHVAAEQGEAGAELEQRVVRWKRAPSVLVQRTVLRNWRLVRTRPEWSACENTGWTTAPD